ncbi:hypothetical protein Vadar_020245 [Vaccinium darrowii]|uniref:Uncharacterized protein n=1 Tax=Vaccinium darrowii TaxID=229202 RepID=A0ACB7ZKD1_9ERIC|nr:hypothetical protein Vadar_020245 [Vaccinium darrowii]
MALFLVLFLILTSVFQTQALRKLGQDRAEFIDYNVAPRLSPSEAPQRAKELSGSNQQREVGQGQQVHIMKKQRHHSIDKSVAGGGVILGGLATTFLVVVFRYIRATRRKNADSTVKNTDSKSKKANSIVKNADSSNV